MFNNEVALNTPAWEEITDSQGEAISGGNLGSAVSEQGPSEELIQGAVITNILTNLAKNKNAVADPSRLEAIIDRFNS
jgi:hypothetical protein